MVSSGITGVLLLTALTGAVMMTWIAGYLQLSASQALVGYLIMLVPIGSGVLIVLGRERPTLVTAARWSAPGANAAYAATSWNAVVRGLPRAVFRCFVGGLAGSLPAAIALVAYWHEPAYAGPAVSAALATGGAAALVISAFGLEIYLRPMVEEIAERLPADFEPERGGLRLRTKALAPLPVVAFYGALAVGAFADVHASGSERLLIALAIAAATVAISALVFLVITRSALAPLDELLAATERVRRGDLARPVPVVTADDLGQLARSFNLMLEGLREREPLRNHNERLRRPARGGAPRGPPPRALGASRPGARDLPSVARDRRASRRAA
jgi:HAMP domain-containing protein